MAVDFAAVRQIVLERPKEEEGITLFGLNDISAMKLRAINNGRREAKDYIDVCYLLEEMSLDTMLENYKKKYACDDITNVKKALSESNMINLYAWQNVKMLKHNFFISDIKTILNNEIQAYNKKHKLDLKKNFFGR
jgi:predicted nucleotidyltransferase component of viral defense system